MGGKVLGRALRDEHGTVYSCSEAELDAVPAIGKTLKGLPPWGLKPSPYQVNRGK